MLAFQAQLASRLGGIVSASAANTGEATSGWVDVRAVEGDIMIESNLGVVTAGTITPTIETASDGAGTGATGMTPHEGAFTVGTTANDPLAEKRSIPAGETLGWIRYVGTIVTGPVLVGVAFYGTPK